MPDETKTSRRDTLTSDIMPDTASRGGAANNMPWIILAVVVLLLVVGAVLFRDKLLPKNESTGSATNTEEKLSGYQAVFLTNGQVYFGKLSDVSATYATLNDIYYLQVTTPPLQGSQDDQASAQAQQQLSLVKLGNELHGPVDEMKINRDQMLFYEDIKEDGRVMQAIREYQKNPPAANGAPAANSAPVGNQQGTTPAANTPATNTAPKR